MVRKQLRFSGSNARICLVDKDEEAKFQKVIKEVLLFVEVPST